VSSELQPRLQAALGDAYRIECELSGGGMSRVFLAEELALGRRVVVKVLPPELAADVNTERFRREIQLAASLQHPNIVPLLSAGSAAGLLYYTMPWVEGESLRAKLAREGELPIEDTIHLLRDVSDALACAHQHAILHRDIKPDNILVSGHHALVADFGVAKALGAASPDGYSTLEGIALGTPTYMAPEQATADPHIDYRADLYALGVVGYEMLTGQPPFPGLVGQAAVAANLTRPAPPVTQIRPSTPAALASLVMRCLEKHPADRWQSAGEILRRLELMSSATGAAVPTIVPETTRRAGRPRRWPLLAGIGVVAALAFSAVVLRQRSEMKSLDGNLLAVAPFDALGGELELWSEGLVDVLSRNLDGAGSLRTVSPSVVIRRWKGRADPVSASALGRSTGAGLTVFGNLIAAGQDSARLTATILDVARDRTLGEVQLRGDIRHMDQLADSLTLSLLRELGRTRDIVAVRTASMRATSLPALKAFLEGERLYRRGAWDSAQLAYRRALAHDSTFVPALRHLGQSLGWRAAGDVEGVTYLRRAGELNHGLPRRDSLLALADSLQGADVGNLSAAGQRSLTERQFATLEEGVRLYPEDPEMWYALGEIRFHSGWYLDLTRRQILDAFDRAIALDSGFTPAYVHPTALALALYGMAGWNRYARPYLSRRPVDKYSDAARLLAAIFTSKRTDSAVTDSLIRSSSMDKLLTAMIDAWGFPDSSETIIRLGRALVAARGQSTGIAQDPLIRRQMLAAALASRGHLREAQTLIGNEDRLQWISSTPPGIALLASSRPETVDSTFRHWLRRRSFWPPGRWPTGGANAPLVWALPWWAARRDTFALAEYARLADSARKASSRPFRRDVAQYYAEAARAYILIAQGDTGAALPFFEARPRDLSQPWERVTLGQILSRRGRGADALELLEEAYPPGGWWGPTLVLARLEAGRLAERLGQRPRAAGHYQFVVDAWRHGDPELQAYLSEARQALTRLTAERRR